MHKPKNIETIKTVLLVVLFLSTVLLLYLNWKNPSDGTLPFLNLTSAPSMEPAPTAEEVTLPEGVVINFDGAKYTVLPPDEQSLWKDCLEQMRAFSRNSDVGVEEITYEKYQEVMDLRSISYYFSYDIPFSSFCGKFGITHLPLYDQIEYLTCVSYSIGSPESIFIADKANNKYYRLVGREVLGAFKEKIAQVEQQGYTVYYTLGTLIGGKSRAVVPLFLETELKETPYIREAYGANDQTYYKFAQLFFGGSLDFIRKITESKGTVIYMYGYGQKVLTINVDGSVEYREDLTSTRLSQDYFEALDLSLEFVGNHGTWNASGGIGMDSPAGSGIGTEAGTEEANEGVLRPYVKAARSMEENKVKGYRFTFGFKAGKGDIFYEDGEAIIVEVLGGQVTYYHRDLVIPDPGLLTQQASKNLSAPEDPANILALNCELLTGALSEAGYKMEGEDRESLLNSITERIEYVESGYMRRSTGESSADREDTLIPIWVVRIEGINFYFDLNDAKLLGYSEVGV